MRTRRLGLFEVPRRAEEVVPERRAERLLVAVLGLVHVSNVERPDADLSDTLRIPERNLGILGPTVAGKGHTIEDEKVEIMLSLQPADSVNFHRERTGAGDVGDFGHRWTVFALEAIPRLACIQFPIDVPD